MPGILAVQLLLYVACPQRWNETKYKYIVTVLKADNQTTVHYITTPCCITRYSRNAVFYNDKLQHYLCFSQYWRNLKYISCILLLHQCYAAHTHTHTHTHTHRHRHTHTHPHTHTHTLGLTSPVIPRATV